MKLRKGITGASLTCAPTQTCLAITASTESIAIGAIGCCDQSDCLFLTACVNAVQYSSESACDNVCGHDSQTLKWYVFSFKITGWSTFMLTVMHSTDATAPYCYGYSFTEWGASIYQCNNIQGSTLDIIETTFVGEVDGRTWSALTIQPTGTSPLTTGPSTPTSPTSTTSLTPTLTHSPSPKQSTPVGAIVGGVIGGLAVIGAVISGLVYMCLRNRRKNRTNDQPPQIMQQAEQSHYPQHPQHPQLSMGSAINAPYAPSHGPPDISPIQKQSQLGYAEDLSPPLSPAPRYSQHGSLSPGPSVKQPTDSPVDRPSELDAPTSTGHVLPPVNRDGYTVYEAGV